MSANAGIVLISRDLPPAVSSPELIVPRIQGHDAGPCPGAFSTITTGRGQPRSRHAGPVASVHRLADRASAASRTPQAPLTHGLSPGYVMKLAFQCVRTRWISGFMPSAGARSDARAPARPVRPQGPYWPGIGWLAAGTSGAGLAKTPCCAVSRPAAAAASVMSCGDRG